MVGTRWVYIVKTRSDGTVERFKAHLVAQDFTRLSEKDHEGDFFSNGENRVNQALVFYCNEQGLAFLQEYLEGDVYVAQPLGFIAVGAKGKVCRLKNTLYGLKQSPRTWFHSFAEVVSEFGLKRASTDHIFFYRQPSQDRDILCIDKTGTLTTDHGIVVDHLDGWGAPREEVLRFAFLNSYFTSEQKHPLDNAILAHVYTGGYRFEPSKWRKLDEIPFDFIRRRVSVVLNASSDSSGLNPGYIYALVVTKGALEDVLKACSFIERMDTGVSVLTLEHRRRILGISERLSNDGLRVIGVAIRRHLLLVQRSSSGDMPHEPDAESNMSFLGLLTFFDPPKESAKQALCRLAEKGVAAKVMTGDSLPLAVRVCREVGLHTEHVITGPELDLLPPDSFDETVERATVLARLTPTQKLRAVRSLRTGGRHVVGFLGDGMNDSLALEAADVGVSVDSGALVAKDRADIILLDNDLRVLVAGVERGRAVSANTVKYVGMSAIANVGAALSLAAATLYLRFEPLTPRQLLVQNFLCNSAQMAIPWDRVGDGVGRPRRRSVGGMAGFVTWNAPVCSACDLGTLVFLWFYYGGGTHHETRFVRTAIFTEGLVMQMLVLHVIRTERLAFVHGVASWQVLCSTALVSAVGLSLPYTPVGAAINLVPLPLSFFGFLLILVFVYLHLAHLVKTLYILLYKNWL